MNKEITADAVVKLIQDNQTVCIGGGGAGHAVPDEVIKALGARFRKTGHPKNLTILHPCGIGDSDKLGLNHLAQAGMLKRVIGGFYGNAPDMVTLAFKNQYEGYNFPQGVLSHLCRAIASGEKGLLTKTGLHTFVDPRYEGGKVNEAASEDLVDLVTIGDDEFLFYKTFPVDAAIIRGTSADSNGNILMDEEVGTFAMLSNAQAAKVNGGIVIAQVARIEEPGQIPSSRIKVPGAFVDHLVVVPDQPMTYITKHDPSLIYRDFEWDSGSLTLDGVKEIVAKRGALELFPGAFVNLGYGISDGIPIVAREEDYLDEITFFIEQGPLGGIPTTGLNFGAMHNPTAILDDGYQFDFFHGGGLDIAYLGFAQVDRLGNVNSSRFGNRMTGCGGFIDISQHSKKVVFCGSFAVKGEFDFSGDGINIINRGKYKKFVNDVDQVTFNGRYAAESGKEVLYLTERCVFHLTNDGLLLTEIAPGADLENDILAMMDFDPEISRNLKQMDARLFSGAKLNLKEIAF
jgi:propionate CoA-transferase